MTSAIVEPRVPLVVKMRYGSHVYGTHLPTSDVDVKAVFLPPAEDILLQRVRDNVSLSTKADGAKANAPGDTDLELFSLQKFVELLLDGHTVAIDMLFTPVSFHLVAAHPCWVELQQEKGRFLHSGVAAIARYCKRQAAKYGIKGSRIAVLRQTLAFLEALSERDRLLDHEPAVEAFVRAQAETGAEVIARLVVMTESPRTNPGRYLEVCDRKVPLDAHVKLAKKIYRKALDEYGERALLAERNQGVDWKAVMHAVRVTNEAKELILTGHVTFPRPERELLLRIRRGELPYLEVADLIERGLAEMEEVRSRSVLRETPDRAAAESFVCRWYRHAVSV